MQGEHSFKPDFIFSASGLEKMTKINFLLPNKINIHPFILSYKLDKYIHFRDVCCCILLYQLFTEITANLRKLPSAVSDLGLRCFLFNVISGLNRSPQMFSILFTQKQIPTVENTS